MGLYALNNFSSADTESTTYKSKRNDNLNKDLYILCQMTFGFLYSVHKFWSYCPYPHKKN